MFNTRLARLSALLLVMVVWLGACETPADLLPGGEPEAPAVDDTSFQLGDLRVVDPQDRPDSSQKVEAEIPKVTELMNSFYSAAFLDPAKWQGGSHPELIPFFTAEAQQGARDNLRNLAMSDLSDKIESVQPSNKRMDQLSFFVDDDGSLPIGLVSVTFEATGRRFTGGDVAIKHQANYWLQREGDSYKISAFATALAAADEGTQ